MSTMTTIERLPGDWNHGSDWAGGAADQAQCDRVSANVEALLDEYLSALYGPHIYRVGSEIHGPATLRFGPENTGGQGRKYQRDTPPVEDLPKLPESIWDEFLGLMEGSEVFWDMRRRRPWAKTKAAKPQRLRQEQTCQ